jgi:hypothetical protein
MLQMTCPNCRQGIESPFLADVTTLECCHCKENIPVKDVFITTRSFTMHREDFLSRIFRFQKLLREVEKERLLMANSRDVSKKSLESLDQFYSSLQELLAGARNSYRIEIPCDLYVEVDDNKRISTGKLNNLSTEGASIELTGCKNLPSKKTKVKISFSFPGLDERLCADAKVVWTRERMTDRDPQSAIIGVTFVEIDQHTHNCIWNYILDNAPVPFQRASR